MASAEKAILNVRVIHIGFVITIFLLVLVCLSSAPTEHPVSHTTVAAPGCAAAVDIAVGFAMRRKRMRDCEQRFQKDANAARTLEIWRVANITSFAQAETVALFGVALKFLGASWAAAGGFLLVGLALMMCWTPRVPVCANTPVLPPPIPRS